MQWSMSWRTMLLVYAITFVLRALVFVTYVEPNNYYKQPDSNDYHYNALLISSGHGMTFPNGMPSFWRTPGYPWFLSWFYRNGAVDFSANKLIHNRAAWVQIAISSIIPILLFYLALLISQSLAVAWIVCAISIIHIGFILGSIYILSEAVALPLFYFFLICFYLFLFHQQRWLYLLGAVVSLSLYTWVRPMGEVVALGCALLLLFCTQTNWKRSLLSSGMFLFFFFLSLSPWYVRNHRLTGEWFFCPTTGTYLNLFCVPKIMRRITGQSYDECWKWANQQASRALHEKSITLKGSGLHVSPLACGLVSWPIVKEHPWWFVYDWFVQNLKTTFDLFSYQLVACATNSFSWDPLEEFLTEKLACALYKGSIPWWIRLLSWLELFFYLFVWIGFFIGCMQFVFLPVVRRMPLSRSWYLWVVSLSIIALVIAPTGGFGYARLRLPVEPLILILSVYTLIYNRNRF